MKRVFIFFAVVALASCSMGPMVEVSGVEVKVMSFSQGIIVESVANDYIDEIDAVSAWYSSEGRKAQDLVERNQINLDQYLERLADIITEKESRLLTIENKYRAMDGVWTPAAATIEFTCSNPSHTNVKLVLSLKYHDGTEGTIEVFPSPLIKGQKYYENVGIRSYKYISEIVSIKVLKK